MPYAGVYRASQVADHQDAAEGVLVVGHLGHDRVGPQFRFRLRVTSRQWRGLRLWLRLRRSLRLRNRLRLRFLRSEVRVKVRVGITFRVRAGVGSAGSVMQPCDPENGKTRLGSFVHCLGLRLGSELGLGIRLGLGLDMYDLRSGSGLEQFLERRSGDRTRVDGVCDFEKVPPDQLFPSA